MLMTVLCFTWFLRAIYVLQTILMVKMVKTKRSQDKSLRHPAWHRPLCSFVPVEDLRNPLTPPSGKAKGTLWKIYGHDGNMYENDGTYAGVFLKSYELT